MLFSIDMDGDREIFNTNNIYFIEPTSKDNIEGGFCVFFFDKIRTFKKLPSFILEDFIEIADNSAKKKLYVNPSKITTIKKAGNISYKTAFGDPHYIKNKHVVIEFKNRETRTLFIDFNEVKNFISFENLILEN